MRRLYDPKLKGPARQLRKDQTPAEGLVWRRLRAEQFPGFRFRRQQPVGPYVVDFFCSRAKLVIEVDGETHIGTESRDAERQAYLEKSGLSVLRLWNTEVYENLEGVLQRIWEVCRSARVPPPREGGGQGEG